MTLLRYFLVFVGLCFAAVASAQSVDGGTPLEEGVAMRRVYFDNHHYILFNNKYPLHDPDCGCLDKYIGWLERRGEDWFVHVRRQRPSDYD